MSKMIISERGLVKRHDLIELIEHWTIAVSGLVLLFSGMFELPMAKRYFITSIPGLTWSGDFIVSLYIHYIASVLFVSACVFHAVYHGLLGDRGMIPEKGDLKASLLVIKSFFGKGAEPPFHKYLPEQRIAYAGMAIIILMLILSGLVKIYKNLYAPDMNYALVLWATWIHNIFFILFFLAFLAHMGALVIKPNRPMVRGIFTGTVRLDYARRRHPLWINELEKELACTASHGYVLSAGLSHEDSEAGGQGRI
jgi:cytochrome b subunit of formate dehydrogenase